jgi:uncharacterized protein YjbJ (UPF0337 family)
MNKDERAGKKENLTGRVKEAVGILIHDEKLEEEGARDRTEGEARETVGKARRKIGEALQDLGDKIKR